MAKSWGFQFDFEDSLKSQLNQAGLGATGDFNVNAPVRNDFMTIALGIVLGVMIVRFLK